MDLSEMSVDDFMKTDWGSEDSSDEKAPAKESCATANHEAKFASTNKLVKKKKRTKPKEDLTNMLKNQGEKNESFDKLPEKKSAHQKDLDRLRDKDPEFYDFLQQEDSSLLNFDKSKFDLDASSDDESGIHKLPEKLEEASDSDLEYDSDAILSDGHDEGLEIDAEPEKMEPRAQIQVTNTMLEHWKEKLTSAASSVPALRDLMKAFHSALARFGQDDGDKKKKKKTDLKFKVESGGTFNAVIGLCIRQVVPALSKILNYHPTKKKSFPSNCKSWVKVRDLLRIYLLDVIALNQLLLEPSVVCATLRHTILLMPYFVCFPKIAKVLLKFLVKSWSSADDESVRVLAFLCINRIIKLQKKKYMDSILKQTYLAYVANCKFTSPSLLPMTNFMQQTLCELFAVNPAMTYQLAFLYIRQLAIHLRKAMTIHKKENYQAVYNWQYVHCLGLWCRAVGNLYSHDEIKPLLYPLVQVSLGTIDLIPTARYFPLRYHIVRYLTVLSDATNTYIPLLPYITKPLRLAEFSRKKGGSLAKPISFSTILKLSNSQLKEAAYRSSTMDELYSGLMEYMNTQAHTISFPEMMLPTIIALKKYAKDCKVPAYSKLARLIIEKVEENSKYILEKRLNVSFSVTDHEAVTDWENSLRKHGLPFHAQYAHYKKLSRKESRQAAADKNRIVEERLPAIDRQKFMELSKTKDREELGKLFADNDSVEDLELDFETVVEGGEMMKKKAAEGKNYILDWRHDEESHSEEELLSNDSGQEEDSNKSLDEHSKNVAIETKGLKRYQTVNKSQETGSKKAKIFDDDGVPDVVEDFRFSSDDE